MDIIKSLFRYNLLTHFRGDPQCLTITLCTRLHRPLKRRCHEKKRAPDPLALEILCDFRGLLSARDGDRLRGIIRFGSRARGDFREECDADLAVFIDPESDPVGAQMDISGDVYLTFLDRGLLIQPWVFQGSPAAPDRTRAAHLLDVVFAEGIGL